MPGSFFASILFRSDSLWNWKEKCSANFQRYSFELSTRVVDFPTYMKHVGKYIFKKKNQLDPI